MSTVCAFESVEPQYQGGVVVVHPNYRKFSVQEGDWTTIHEKPFLKAHIPDLHFWFLGEGIKGPNALGVKLPVHGRCNDPYCFDNYFRLKKPELVSLDIRRQLDEATAIMGDRPQAMIDSSDLPTRGLRRNAWGLDSTGTRVIDRKYMTTPQEAVAAFLWKRRLVSRKFFEMMIRVMQSGKLVPVGDSSESDATASNFLTLELLSQLHANERSTLEPGEVDSLVSDWRGSDSAPSESAFKPPKNAVSFDVRWFRGAGEGGFPNEW